MSKARLVNGKHYPMWEQVVNKDWVRVIDSEYSDEIMELESVTLEPNGDDSAKIVFKGKYRGEDEEWFTDVSAAYVGSSHHKGFAIGRMYGGTFILQNKEHLKEDSNNERR